MPVITRDDGIDFAIYTYRELLTAKKPNLLKREIELLRQENGDYARFFEQPAGDIEAVFSQDAGYLLGETVWTYLDKPNDLILCEALANGEDAILVVVRAGVVYLDAVLPINNLVDEFVSLVSIANQYEIYVYGDVPLAKNASDEKFAFADNFVQSFTELDDPIFPALKTDDDLELLPINQAIAELQVGGASPLHYVAILAVIAVLGFALWKLFEPAPAPVAPVVVQTYRDPYQEYKQALTTPSPSEQIERIVASIRDLYTLPGWEPTTLAYDGSNLSAQLDSAGGGADILLAWVRTHNAKLVMGTGRASLTIPLAVANRRAPATLYDLKDMVARIHDQLALSLPEGKVSIGKSTELGKYWTTEVKIDFTDVSLDVLLLMAKQLKGLPIVLNKCAIRLADGMSAGSLELLVLGTVQS